MPKDNPSEKPLPIQMLDLIFGYWISQFIYVVVRLGLADRLEQGPMKVDDLAKLVNVEMRDFALMMVDGYNWKSWHDLHESVKEEKIAFDRVHGMPRQRG